MTNKPDLRHLLANLFTESNRGLLLDLVVFVANLFLMRTLAGLFLDLFSYVSAGDPFAKFALFLTALAMYVLPVAGAVLKRWHFQQRWKQTHQSFEADIIVEYGCLF